MKDIIIQSEHDLLDALIGQLAMDDYLSVRIAEGAGASSVNGHPILKLNLDGHIIRLKVFPVLEARADIIERLTAEKSSSPLLATVSLSESLTRNCRENGISHADLNGRIWIRDNGVLIERNTPSTALRYRTADREPDFFSLKSSRLARVLLSNPDRAWRQADLTRLAGLSQGLVSRLLNHAAKLGWVEGFRGDWRLIQADALLDAWAAADKWRKRVTVRQYSTYEANLDALARGLMDELPGDIAFTQWFAASLRFPYTEPPLLSAYRRCLPAPDELAKLDLREVGDGGRLWILVHKDEGVFQEIRCVNGIPVVCDVQIYLDLLQVGLRGPDQAKVLREWKGFRKS